MLSWYTILKTNAKRRNKVFTLTFAEFSHFCITTGYDKLKGKTANSLSIDRIDNEKGYTVSNIRTITLSENSSKGIGCLGMIEEDPPF